MPNPKPIVFISHVTEEGELAALLKDLVNDSFLDLIDMFVSSDGERIRKGTGWFDEVTNALDRCELQIIVCSPISISRPWINFEAGAAWIRGVPVIPLCHSGMEPSKLPVPYNLRQATNATTVADLEGIFRQLANTLGSSTPRVDFSEFVESVRDFEERYTFWGRCNAAFELLYSVQPQLIPELREAVRQGWPNIYVDLSPTELDTLELAKRYLKDQKILRIQPGGSKKVMIFGNQGPEEGSGDFTTVYFYPLERLASILDDDKFAF
jgi:hypothetical protein